MAPAGSLARLLRWCAVLPLLQCLSLRPLARRASWRSVAPRSESGEAATCETAEECLAEAQTQQRLAEMLRLSAEKLRLEAAKDELSLARERLTEQRMADAVELAAQTLESAAVSQQQEADLGNLTAQRLESAKGVSSVEAQSAEETYSIKDMVGSGSEESASVRRKRELTETVTATAMKQLFPQAAETMTPELAEKMKIEVFGKSKFFNCESVDDCSRGAIFRGTRRGSNENEGYTAVLEDLSDLLARSPSLGAWRFFAMEDPVLPGEEELERRSEESIERVTMSAQFGQVSDDDIDNMFRFPVVIIAIAAETRPFGADVGWTAWPKADKLVRMAVAFALGSLTFFTGATYAADAGLLNPALVSHIEVADKIAADLVLPTFDALLTIFIFHEAAHQVSARYNNMSWSFPVALPSLQIGSALSVNVLNDYAPNRKALFDTAVVGPVVGLALSLLLLAYGASLSDLTDATPLRVPVPVLRSSFLAYSTVLLAAPAEIRTVLDDAATQLVPLHPLAVAGFAGVLTNAVALLPLGRTDGGRALLCTVGRPVADGAVWAAAVATGVVGFFQPNDLLMTHILLVLGCQRGLEAPCVDEIAPVGRLRKNVHALLLLIAFSALVGAPFNSDGFIDTGLQSGFPGLTA